MAVERLTLVRDLDELVERLTLVLSRDVLVVLERLTLVLVRGLLELDVVLLYFETEPRLVLEAYERLDEVGVERL